MADITAKVLMSEMMGREGLMVIMKAILRLKNEINVLGGKPEVTDQQYMNYLKTQLDLVTPYGSDVEGGD